MPGKRQPLAKRFWAKVRKTSTCWEWTAKTSGPSGFQYGMIHRGGTPTKLIQATHVAWYLATGKWPTHQICHYCDNTLCVRFEHLFDGTQSDNMQDCKRKGRAGRKDWFRGRKHTLKTKARMAAARRLYWQRQKGLAV